MSAALDPSTFALRVVAVSPTWNLRLRPWEKDALAVDAGLFVYGPTAPGAAEALALLGAPADYAYQARGDDLVGFDTQSVPRNRRFAVHPDRLIVLQGFAKEGWESYGWTPDAKHWQPARDLEPERIYDVDAAGGAMGRDQQDCAQLHSASDTAYFTCQDKPFAVLEIAAEAKRTGGSYGDVILEKRSHLPGLAYDGPMAVARDDALWFGRNGTAVRATPDAAMKEFALPEPPADLLRPYFAGTFDVQMSAIFVGGRYWQETSLERPPHELRRPEITHVVALRDGTVWFEVARKPYWLIYRWGPPNVNPIYIGTQFDQQIEIRNAKSLRPWDGKCPQAFVVPKSVIAHAPKGTKLEAHVVEGKLGSRAVKGVLLHQRTPDASTKDLAKLVADLGGEAFCSVPVVTKVLE